MVFMRRTNPAFAIIRWPRRYTSRSIATNLAATRTLKTVILDVAHVIGFLRRTIYGRPSSRVRCTTLPLFYSGKPLDPLPDTVGDERSSWNYRDPNRCPNGVPVARSKLGRRPVYRPPNPSGSTASSESHGRCPEEDEMIRTIVISFAFGK